VLVDQPELTAGDVLLCDEERAVVVTFEQREAFVITFHGADTAVSTAIELGHRIGNQHWDITVDRGTIYIPVDADRAIIEEVLGPYIPDGATTRYDVVDAERFVDGSEPDTGHSHSNYDGSHDHSHEHDDHDHNHEHDDSDHTHGHEHDHDHSSDASPTTTPLEEEPQ
jgi:urease accessory protein